MDILSVFLLTLAVNIDTLKVSSANILYKAAFSKFKMLFIAVFTSIITFLSICLGKIIDIYFTQNLSNILGIVLLGFIGVYYIVEHIRKEINNAGYDTSYFVEDFSKHKNIIELGKIKDNSSMFKNLINFSFALSLNNIWPCIAGSLMGMGIGLIILLNFIICISSFIVGPLIKGTSIINYIKSNHYLLSSILLILLFIIQICIYLFK